MTLILGGLATSIAGAIFSGLTSWVASGAASVVGGVGRVLSSSTAAPFNSGFTVVFVEVERVGAPLAAIFMALAVVRAVLRQDLADLGRMVLIRLPLAFIGSGIALELVVLAMKATDSLSAALIGTAESPARHFISVLSGTLVLSGGSPPGGFAALVVAVVCGAIAFILWIELVVRSSAIAIATLFLPLAMAGTVWSATAVWARRLAEVLGALILSKLVIAGVFAVAITEIGDPTGLAGLIQGASVLLLATFAPWTLLRLIPSVETGIVAQLEGLGSRAKAAVSGPMGDVVDHAFDTEAFALPLDPQIPETQSKPYDTPDFRALVAHFEDTLPPPGSPAPSRFGQAGQPLPSPSGSDGSDEES